MATVSQYRQEITLAVTDMRKMIILLTRMIEEGQDKASILAVVRQFTEKVNKVETESVLHDDQSIEKSISLMRYCQQRDKAYRERDWMAHVLRQMQEDQHRPKLSAAELKEKLEKTQAARERDKKRKKPRQPRLFD